MMGRQRGHPPLPDHARQQLHEPVPKRSLAGGAHLEAMKAAEAEGKGAVSLDGRLIDYASIRQAQVLVEKVKMIAWAGSVN
jgi:citrate lyase beta subunit